MTVDELIYHFPLKTNFYFYRDGQCIEYKYISGQEFVDTWIVNNNFDVLIFL